jgi:hypothetical protein
MPQGISNRGEKKSMDVFAFYSPLKFCYSGQRLSRATEKLENRRLQQAFFRSSGQNLSSFRDLHFQVFLALNQLLFSA